MPFLKKLNAVRPLEGSMRDVISDLPLNSRGRFCEYPDHETAVCGHRHKYIRFLQSFKSINSLSSRRILPTLSIV